MYSMAREMIVTIRSCESFIMSCADDETKKKCMVAMATSVKTQISNMGALDFCSASQINEAINASVFDAEVKNQVVKTAADVVLKVGGHWTLQFL